MSRRLFLHIGLPKSGTTYLQSSLWAGRSGLREAGLLLPGSGPREHLWASADLREEKRLARRHRDAPGSWVRLVDEVLAWPGDSLISHEFFGAASTEQVERALALVAGRLEVHVVLTLREPVSLLATYWQEWVKNGGTRPIEAFPVGETYDPADEWGWGAFDLADILDRWSGPVPDERVHLLCPPGQGAPDTALLDRFAALVGFDPALADPGAARPNRSLGLVAVELMRRVNAHASVSRPRDRGVWLRGYLGHEVLAGLGAERFWPPDEQVEHLRRRGREALDLVASRGFDVVGDLDTVRTPDRLEERRVPAMVSDAEVAEVAARAMARMLADVKEAREASTTGPAVAAVPGTVERLVTLARRARPGRRTRR